VKTINRLFLFQAVWQQRSAASNKKAGTRPAFSNGSVPIAISILPPPGRRNGN
jgi:hypothetical protein